MINVTRLSDRAYGYKVFNPDWSCNPREHDAQDNILVQLDLKTTRNGNVQKRGMTFLYESNWLFQIWILQV